MTVKTWRTAWTTRIKIMPLTGATAAGVAVALAISCAQSPTSPTGSATVTTPALLAPANGAQIANLKQPVTLTIGNAFVTDSSATVLYTFEIATDAAFASKVQTPTASPGNGQTSVVLNPLTPGQSYFWHARATGGGTVGLFSATGTFTVGPALALTTPNPLSPQAGATPSGWPTFTVTNSNRTGPVVQLTYRFDVSTTPTFASTILSATVPEGPHGQTSFTPPLSTPVPVGTLLYWRATAIDAPDGITSAASATLSFTPQTLTEQAILANTEGLTLWPGIQPPGTNGHATLGDGWDIGAVTSFNGVTFLSPPLELLQEFDLIDRGMDPQAAIDWMHANGYFNDGVWAPPTATSPPIVGFPFEYIFQNNHTGAWDLVVRVGG
jgi:hypothetical protein